ncbi:MAG: BREX system Lon protease-like protein BrxL [Bacteroidales bacterium]|jgi:ATP-dependent Lon protease|nr:BREX system Lon protease-like protein BrxL [Bacteroidales bacterium]
MNNLDTKINSFFAGKVVRKDLTKLVKGNAVVPTYVLEYLLGQYCASDDEATINDGVERVKDILTQHYVHRDEAQFIMNEVRRKGSHRIIDKINVRLNDQKDQNEAYFANLGLKRVPISDQIVKEHKKLLSDGVWCIVNLAYIASDEKGASPWLIESLKPIQISNVDIEEFKSLRSDFTSEEWIDLLMQTMGLNPDEFTRRSKILQLCRLVPFVENNYNLIELGPKGTGKSHVYSEFSPHGILISGGEISKAKLFVNNTTGEIGLVGYWDVVTYDEFAGRSKRVDTALVDIMKNYMANKSFSRGTQVYGASASMAFVGNTDSSLAYMLNHSNLFEALPKDYYDTAFLDRIHAYLPGWEVDKLRNDMFTHGYGFVVDYLAEVLRELRKEDWTNDYRKHFELSNTITTRDKTSIMKTYAGLCKIIYPDKSAGINELKELFEFAVESRRRVKQQLQKMDETFEDVEFVYSVIGENRFKEVVTLEEIQYLGKGNIYIDSDNEDVVEHKNKAVPQLVGKHVEIFDNQKGVSYKNLFGEYFKGTKEITITDPYIRLPYQIRNLVELVNLITGYKEIDETVRVNVITDFAIGYEDESKERFQNLQDNLYPVGIDFSYRFDDSIHDRYILIDNNWKILLGRGLDIWNKTNGMFDIAETNQLYRSCKAFSMTVVWVGEEEENAEAP